MLEMMIREKSSFIRDAGAGPLLGCLLALVEFLAHSLRGTPLLFPSLLPGMLVLYVLFWTLAGVATATLLTLLRRLPLRAFRGCNAQAALLSAIAVALTGHAVIVSHFLIDLQRPFTSILLGGALAAILPLYFLFRRLIPEGWMPRYPLFLLLPAMIVFGSLPFQLIPERRGAEVAGNRATAATGPNILLIVFDTLRYDHIGAYGYERETTPTLDRIARRGVLFNRAYAPSSWTLPSTASLLTGRYPSSHGVQSAASALPDDVESLLSVLRQEGYRTGLFSGNPFVVPNFGFGQGAERIHATIAPMYLRLFYLPVYLKRTIGRQGLFPGGSDRVVTKFESLWRGGLKQEWIDGEELVREMFGWIDERDDRPFFAHMQIMEPHDPYVGLGRFGPEGVSRGGMPGVAPLHPWNRVADPSADRARTVVGRYDDDIWSADRVLESIERSLEERGLLDETWIVLTADHGEEFWDHGGLGHGNSLFEELIRVPLVFSGKGIVPRRIDSFARLIDIAPTLAALAGVPPPDGSAGVSLLPVLLGETGETGISSVFAQVNRSSRRGASMLLSADGLKIIRSHAEGEEVVFLFDVIRDPAEKEDLSEDDPARRIRAIEELREVEERASAGNREGAAPALDPVTEQRLRALGYIK